MSDKNWIELTGEDGSVQNCRMLDVVQFENKEYAVMLTQNEDAVVIMLLVETDKGTVFRTIQDDKEFGRVSAFVQALAQAQSDDDK